MSSCCTPATDETNSVAEGAGCCTVPNEQEAAPNTAFVQHCPVCGQKGKGVDTQTVKAMLDISLHAIRPSGYGFCCTEDCPVVYFSRDGEHHMQCAQSSEDAADAESIADCLSKPVFLWYLEIHDGTGIVAANLYRIDHIVGIP